MDRKTTLRYFSPRMMVLVLPLIVFASAGLLGFALLYKSAPVALINFCVLLLIGFFLQPWQVFSPPPDLADIFRWKLVLLVWLVFFLISIVALSVMSVMSKKRHRHRRYTF